MRLNGHDQSKAARIRAARIKSKKEGDAFENNFETMCKKYHVKVTRFPNGGKRMGPRFVQVPTPFDWVCSFSGKSALIDTKSSSENFPHSLIKDHQVKDLLEHEMHGTIAGYVIWLRKTDQVIFMTASFLFDKKDTKGSIDHETRGAIPIGTGKDFDPTKIFARFSMATWMQKEIDEGPKS